MSTSANDSGNNGGFDSTEVKSLLVFGVAYGVATAIAVKTIDLITSGWGSKKEKPEVRTPPPNKKTSLPSHLPPHCNYVFDFYQDCLRDKKNICDPYREVIKKCQAAAGVSSQTSPGVNNDFPAGLFFLSFRECLRQGSIKREELLYGRYAEEEVQYRQK